MMRLKELAAAVAMVTPTSLGGGARFATE